MKSFKIPHHPGNNADNWSDVGTELEKKSAGPSPAASTDNAIVRWDGTGGRTQQNSLLILDDSGNLVFPTATGLLTGLSAGNTLIIAARDVDGAAYTTFITLTANNTPTCDLAAAVTKGGVGIATLNTNTWAQQQGFALQTLTDAATISWNLQTQQTAVVTLGGNRTLDTPSNMTAGFTYVLFVVQDGTGSRTLAYHADYLFPGGVDPVLSTAANAVDVLTFVSRGSKMYGVIQKAFA